MKSQLLLGLALFCMTALTGCLAPIDSQTPDQTSGSLASAKEVTVQSELSQCTPAKEGSVVYVRSSDSFFTCDSNVWVALNLKGEKGDRGEAGAPPPAPISPCLNITEETLRYGDKIDGGDYSFNAIRSLPDQKYCLASSANIWVDFQPSLKLMTSAPTAQILFEENLCKAAFAIAIIKDYYQWKGGGAYFLQIKNGNMSASLRRAIICDPDMYGVSTIFPGN